MRRRDAESQTAAGGGAGVGSSHTAPSSPLKTYVVLPALCVGCGLLFGLALEKGKVLEPQVIRQQMVLNHFAFIKFFISAMAMGLFGMSLLAMLPGASQRFASVCSGYYNKLQDKGALSSTVGGLLLGAGLVISGSCPITVFAQLGAMVPNAMYTFLGCVAGTLTYGILQSALDGALKPSQGYKNPWRNSPFFTSALPAAAILGTVVCACEVMVPWEKEVTVRNGEADLLHRSAWPPYLSGIVIGALHMPLMLSIGEALGGSSSFLVMLAQVLVGPLKDIAPITKKFQWGFKRWWQMFYVGGIVGGGYMSASASGSLATAKGVSVGSAFLGGFLACLGSRIAGGCTSGHGFSGTGFLNPVSFILTAAMFGGAFVTARYMQSAHSLDL